MQHDHAQGPGCWQIPACCVAGRAGGGRSAARAAAGDGLLRQPVRRCRRRCPQLVASHAPGASHAPARGGLTCGGLAAVCQLVAWHAPAHCCAMGCRGSQRMRYGCRSPRTSGCPTGHPAHARSSGRPRMSCAAPLLRRPSLTWVFARHARGAASGAQRARLQGLTGGRRAPLAGLCARCTSPARRAWRRPWPGSWTTRAMPTWTRPSWCLRRAPVTLCPHPRASKTCALFWDQCHRRRPCSGMVAAAGRLLLACPSAPRPEGHHCEAMCR